MVSRIYTYLPLFYLLLLPGYSNIADATELEAQPMVVRYHVTESLITLNSFQFDLIQAALDITRPEFGDYEIQPYKEAPNAKRQAILLTEGELLNVQWASPGTPIAHAEAIQIPFNFLQDMLGYRVCLLNGKAHTNLENFGTLNLLRDIRIGQGYDWLDINIYRHNDIPVRDYPGLKNLMPALSLNRIDCVALGINEVEFTFKEYKSDYDFLKVDSSLIFYYEYPIYFYVSKKHPKLAKRLGIGFEKIKKNGQYDQLFYSYYAKNIKLLQLHKRKIICLKNPYLDQADQCTTPVILPKIQGITTPVT